MAATADKPWWYGPDPKSYVVGRIEFDPRRIAQYIDYEVGYRRRPRGLRDDTGPTVDCHDDAVCDYAIRLVANMFPQNVERFLIAGPGHLRPMPV